MCPAKSFIRPLLLSAILWVGTLCATAHAQQQMRMLQVSAGTGFVINRDGHLVTNNHVVRQCQRITIMTPAGERPASIVANDAGNDLAVLKLSDLGGANITPLRWNISDLKIGDSVTMIGFPGQAGIEGRSSTKKTTVTALQGPEGQPRFIQLASVAEHGNSGGPILDSAGNVIAVITGISQTYWVDKSNPSSDPKLVHQSDVALTLATVQDFLQRNQIPYYQSLSSGAYSDASIQNNALTFILPIRCIQGEVGPIPR